MKFNKLTLFLWFKLSIIWAAAYFLIFSIALNIDLKHNNNGVVVVGNGTTAGKITTSGQQNLELSTYSNNANSSKIIILFQF